MTTLEQDLVSLLGITADLEIHPQATTKLIAVVREYAGLTPHLTLDSLQMISRGAAVVAWGLKASEEQDRRSSESLGLDRVRCSKGRRK